MKRCVSGRPEAHSLEVRNSARAARVGVVVHEPRFFSGSHITNVALGLGIISLVTLIEVHRDGDGCKDADDDDYRIVAKLQTQRN